MSRQEAVARADGAPRPAPRRILLATVDSLAQPYEILGLVEAAVAVPTEVVPTARLFYELENQAITMGANGVIGIRLSQHSLPGTSMARLVGRGIDHYGGTVQAIAIGTAIRVSARPDAGRRSEWRQRHRPR